MTSRDDRAAATPGSGDARGPARLGRRLQLSRRPGWRLPTGARSVAYPTRWQNPFRPAGRSREANAAAVRACREHLRRHPELVAAARAELAGVDLACWCAPALDCHAEVLAAVAAGEQP